MTTGIGAAGQVYLVGSLGSRFVKIGYSRNPEKRLWFLQVGSPVELSLLATFEGGPDLEAQLHRYFGAHNVRG
ncbi:GIY-YIG nuclease family protein [Streptomyces geranii]|uniref:GIY-YIG nuclease family protein n=1 Tax=Streptomyces geranii TaxID=2058923 RepID=UPI000D0472CC|nr:GIY-YIG nuclease family protein [Streptomyces geranii]